MTRPPADPYTPAQRAAYEALRAFRRDVPYPSYGQKRNAEAEYEATFPSMHHRRLAETLREMRWHRRMWRQFADLLARLENDPEAHLTATPAGPMDATRLRAERDHHRREHARQARFLPRLRELLAEQVANDAARAALVAAMRRGAGMIVQAAE